MCDKGNPIDLAQFVNLDEIDIGKDEWTLLNENFSKDEIKEMISDIIDQFNIGLPFRKITEKEAQEDFKELKEKDCLDLIKHGEFYCRYDYKYPLSHRYIDQSNTGNKSSDFYHQEQRWNCNSINSPSPYRTWNTKKFRLTLFNALWTLKYDKINTNTLRSAIGLRKHIAAQFRPSAAKAIYQFFDAKNILDFSTGWGDRLSAFLATNGTEHYVGCDPNQNLYEDYQKQIDEFGSSSKKVNLHPVPAEETRFEKKTIST